MRMDDIRLVLENIDNFCSRGNFGLARFKFCIGIIIRRRVNCALPVLQFETTRKELVNRNP